MHPVVEQLAKNRTQLPIPEWDQFICGHRVPFNCTAREQPTKSRLVRLRPTLVV